MSPLPKRLLLSFVLAAALNSTASAQSVAETSFKQDLALEKVQTVEYFDEAGQRLDFEAFLKLVSSGRSFNIAHPTAASAAISIAGKNAAPSRPATYKLAPGAAFPTFKLRSNRGAMVDNRSLGGKVTLINFLFATCAPCIAELPVLNAFAKAHPEIQSLGVTFDSASEARQFAVQRHFEWPLLADGQAVVDAVGVSAYPAFALVGADGRILALSTSHEIAGEAKQLDVDNLFAWTKLAQSKDPSPHQGVGL